MDRYDCRRGGVVVWIVVFAVVPGGMGVNTPGTGTTVLAVSHVFSMV